MTSSNCIQMSRESPNEGISNRAHWEITHVLHELATDFKLQKKLCVCNLKAPIYGMVVLKTEAVKTVVFFCLFFSKGWGWGVRIQVTRESWTYKINLYLSKVRVIYTMKHCSAIKRNEVPIRATVHVTLENISYVKGARHKRPHTAWFHLWIVQKRQIHRDRKIVWWLPRVGALGGKCGVTANEYEVLFGIKMFWN